MISYEEFLLSSLSQGKVDGLCPFDVLVHCNSRHPMVDCYNCEVASNAYADHNIYGVVDIPARGQAKTQFGVGPYIVTGIDRIEKGELNKL